MREYDRADASFYDYYVTGVTGDVEFYVNEALKANSPVLELGCGTGRILLPVAKSGVEIVGLDNSHEMLEIAKKKIGSMNISIQKRIEIVDGDMRNFSLGRKFKLIMIPFRAFLHNLTSDDQKNTLKAVREHLDNDGKLVFNFFDPRISTIAAHMSVHGTEPMRDREFVHPVTQNKVVVWSSPFFKPAEQFIEQYFIFEELDNEGCMIKKRYVHLKLRYLFRYEMQYLLDLCGFEIEELYGDFAYGPFVHGNEQIWIARKRQ